MTNLLDHALSLARRGFRVFPLRLNRKEPAFVSCQAAATHDEATLRSWWTENPNYNVGVATGRWAGDGDLVVVDADCKDGKAGLASLELMEMLVGIPETLRVRTVSGGAHLFLLMPADTGITVSADRIPDYPAIDIRGQGGYVASIGSVVDGGNYTVEADAPSAVAPSEIVDLARSAQGPARETKDREAVTEVDTLESVLRLAEWLRNGAPEAIEGAGGDHMTYIVVCRLRDYGLSASAAFELMSTHWNDAGKASPPWGPEELQQNIQNAFAYAKNPQGARLASAKIEVVPEDEAPPRRGDGRSGSKVDRPRSSHWTSRPQPRWRSATTPIGLEAAEEFEQLMPTAADRPVFGIGDDVFVREDHRFLGGAMAKVVAIHGRSEISLILSALAGTRPVRTAVDMLNNASYMLNQDARMF